VKVFKFTAFILLSALQSPGLKADPIDMGPYIVFFEWDSATLSDETRTTLENAVRAYKTNEERLHWTMQLAGFADRSGQLNYNQALADRRIASIRAFLESRGVAANRFESRSYGEDEEGLRVPTADGVRSSQNRRVEIYFQPPSPQID
jgi:OmpA-OmpF porin, OOP family